jgi:hypothetical protein
LHAFKDGHLTTFQQISLARRREEASSGISDRGREKRSERPLSIFDSKEAGPLFGYSEHVDYTIGRKFETTNSGQMGLVPGATQEGDVVI